MVSASASFTSIIVFEVGLSIGTGGMRLGVVSALVLIWFSFDFLFGLIKPVRYEGWNTCDGAGGRVRLSLGSRFGHGTAQGSGLLFCQKQPSAQQWWKRKNTL